MYATTELKAIAVLSQWTGEGFGPSLLVDISRITCQYQRNSIPSATMTIPLGREVKTLQFSNAHELAPGPMDRIAIKVYIQGRFMSGDINALVPLGSETFLLFEGWVSGLSYERERSSYAAKLEAEHWISGLNFSSALSSSSCPKNPADFSFPSDVNVLEDAGAKDSPVWSEADKLITPEVLENNLWSGFAEWFKWLASEDRLFKDEGFFAGEGQNDSNMKEVQAVLSQIQNPVPLRLVVDQNVVDIAAGIAQDLSGNVFGPDGEPLALAQLTIWEKLVGYMTSSYYFDVIALPNKVFVVPVVPTLRQTWRALDANYSILGRDQASLKFESSLKRPIRAVGLFPTKISSDTGLQEIDINNQAAGFYEARPFGIVLFRQLPPFLSEASTAWLRSYTDNVDLSTPDLVHPEGADDPPEQPKPDVKQRQIKFLGDRIARAMYLDEALKDRTGLVVGPLRFDICPGSNISGQGLADVGDWFGTVQSVNYFVDTEEQKALTVFGMSHIRSVAENMSNSTSTNEHPLYQDIWVGDWLVQ